MLQGERSMAAQNVTLGRFSLDGIPPAPRGIPKIEVKFDIDVNGIVNVSAKDLATGKSQQISITSSSGLSPEEIERMVKDAESHAAEDERFRELAEQRNQADQLCYQSEKMLTDLGDKVPADKATTIREEIQKVREAAKGDDLRPSSPPTMRCRSMSTSWPPWSTSRLQPSSRRSRASLAMKTCTRLILP